MTQGASILLQRKAARNVSVRQRPCGTLATRRWPRRQRPRWRVILVFGPSLVDEDQAARIKAALVLLPLGAPAGDVGAVLLGGEQALFSPWCPPPSATAT